MWELQFLILYYQNLSSVLNTEISVFKIPSSKTQTHFDHAHFPNPRPPRPCPPLLSLPLIWLHPLYRKCYNDPTHPDSSPLTQYSTKHTLTPPAVTLDPPKRVKNRFKCCESESGSETCKRRRRPRQIQQGSLIECKRLIFSQIYNSVREREIRGPFRISFLFSSFLLLFSSSRRIFWKASAVCSTWNTDKNTSKNYAN